MPDSKAIQQLDLNLLKVFETLYQQQNMTRTAEVLHITPSAVSHAIKRLRECLNDPLFEKRQKRMLPTPACQRLAPLLLENLARLRQVLQQWSEFEPASSQQQFVLAIPQALEPILLPELNKNFLALAPNASLASVKANRERLGQELAAGLDVAIDVVMPMRSPVHHSSLLTDNFSVLMRHTHPLVGRLTKASYLKARHISVSNRPSGAVLEDVLVQQQGMQRSIFVRCQNYAAAKLMLRDTDYLLTLPSRLAQQMCDDNYVIAKPPISLPDMTTHMYWHQQSERDSANIWLRELIAQTAEQLDSNATA